MQKMSKFFLVGLIPKDKGTGGGAWKGTSRLFIQLDKYHGKGNIKLLVSIKNLKKDFISNLYPFKISGFFYYIMAVLSRILNHLILINYDRPFSFNFLPSLLDIGAYFSSKKGDNLYLHWVGNNFISLWILFLITKNKKVLIKFADYWWLTGGCHYPKNCDLPSKNNCIDCPLVKKRFRWIPKYMFFLKRQILNRENVKIISPSKHLYQTTLNCLDNKNIYHILNGVEILPYKKRDLSIKSIGIIAHCFKDSRKNGKQVKEILDLLVQDPSLVINICGDYSSQLINSITNSIECKINNFGFIENEQKMRDFYHKSNYILFLSLEDNAPNQTMEAMSNGSIMITFNNSFSTEHIKDNLNGFLIPINFSNEKIFDSIVKAVNSNKTQNISEEAYNYAIEKFSISSMANNYNNLLV